MRFHFWCYELCTDTSYTAIVVQGNSLQSEWCPPWKSAFYHCVILLLRHHLSITFLVPNRNLQTSNTRNINAIKVDHQMSMIPYVYNTTGQFKKIISLLITVEQKHFSIFFSICITPGLEFLGLQKTWDYIAQKLFTHVCITQSRGSRRTPWHFHDCRLV